MTAERLAHVHDELSNLDVVAGWLQATPEVAGLYERLGYRYVESYLSLAPPGTPPP